MNQQLSNRQYWRSLEHLAGSPEIERQIEAEFPGYDPDHMLAMGPLTRRKFMKLMGASMALAGLTLSGCRRWPEEKLVPYTSNPNNRTPGVPEQYATIMEIDGVGHPLLVTSYDGRPIKIEGNPTHPYSATAKGVGSADVYAQASLLELYDPDRSRTVTQLQGAQQVPVDWDSFAKAMQPMMASIDAAKGQGFAVLCEGTLSPSVMRMKQQLMEKYPNSQWYEYQPISRDNELTGSRYAFGQAARPVFHLDKTDMAVLLDADILGSHPARTKYAGDWAKRRRDFDNGIATRLYMAEPLMSTTGSVADARAAMRYPMVGLMTAYVSNAAGLKMGRPSVSMDYAQEIFTKTLTKELPSFRGRSLLSIGTNYDPALHAWIFAANAALGAYGSTITLLQDPAGDRPTHIQAITSFVNDAKAGKIKTVLILGGNPVYDAPVDLDFSTALGSVGTAIHLSLYQNETSLACQWHVPRAHYLEAWGDARAWDGTISVCQPLIEPLFGGKTPAQMLGFFAGQGVVDSDAIVRKTFEPLLPKDDFEHSFRQVLHDGLLKGTEFPPMTAAAKTSEQLPAMPALRIWPWFELHLKPDAKVYDGRFANNGWLQELPDPITKLVWDNAITISPHDADANGLETGDVVQLTMGDDATQFEAPVFVVPGQVRDALGFNLGYGRVAAGHIGDGVGFNSYKLRLSDTPDIGVGVLLKKVGRKYTLASTQDQSALDSLGAEQVDAQIGPKNTSGSIIQEATLAAYIKDPQIFRRNDDGSIALQLFDPPNNFSDDHRWGMAIDMSSCIGCHACVVACQSENNVPIVGKDQVLNNRQMHWIRIDRYFKGPPLLPDVEVVYQPVTCQHCENAPCEQVCPVGATMHDSEGLNVMVYNRCIGTRYCSNNCPYKVRRFNYLDWQSLDPRNNKYPKPYLNIPDQQQLEQVDKLKAMVFNPEVTVRMRGVMEKCTFCVQRIHNTKIRKRNAGEELVDGDIVTACQQACPTQAIIFGDLLDPTSRVSQMHRSPRAYGLLDELNTRPRNKYLAKISNPLEA